LPGLSLDQNIGHYHRAILVSTAPKGVSVVVSYIMFALHSPKGNPWISTNAKQCASEL
jgi:hypothetical protein